MKKKKKGGFPLAAVLAAVFTAGFLFCGVMALKTLYEARVERLGFQRLAEIVADGQAEPAAQPASQGRTDETVPEGGWAQSPQTVSPYAPLKEMNPDFFGWISIEGTVVDYPVMYTPQDPEHYIHRDFEGSPSQSGVPFLSGSWKEGCGNYLIYGHHMKNGSMFASLVSYAKESYWREHPVIHFETLTDSADYEVLAAFYSRVYEREEQGVFRYYDYTDLSREDLFDSYLDQVTDAALYDTGVRAAYGDTLLTLSTCSYHTDDGRFVVVARRAG